MIKKTFFPKIPEYFNIINTSENEVLVEHSGKAVKLKGKSAPLIKKLIPYFDGRLSIEKISKKSKIPIEEITSVVEVLNKKGILFDEDGTVRDGITKEDEKKYKKYINLFSKTLGCTSRFIPISKLKSSSILLISNGSLGRTLLKMLNSSGVENIKNLEEDSIEKKKDVSNLVKSSDLVVLCLNSTSINTHNFINKLCVEHKKPWISSRLESDGGEIGPTVVPFKTACFKCLDYRLQSNIPSVKELTELKEYIEKSKIKFDFVRPFLMVVAGFALLEIIKILTNYDTPVTLNSVVTVSFDRYTTKVNRLLKIPHCPVCGYEK